MYANNPSQMSSNANAMNHLYSNPNLQNVEPGKKERLRIQLTSEER